MKLFSSTTTLIGFIRIAIIALAHVVVVANAANVTYSVVAFPGKNEMVAVHINGTNYPLRTSPLSANLFTGSAPFGSNYQYVYLAPGDKQRPESTVRHLTNTSITSTGNEFFNRSKTIYDVPELPRAFNPIYPALHSGLGKSNEISTILLNVDFKSLQKILKAPLKEHKFAEVYNMTFISHNEVFNYQGAGIKNSGQSSREFAKQSFKIKFNKFNNATRDELYGRRALKLRAEATDPSMAREKLLLDSLNAAGAATLSGDWVRLFVNNKPFGLYLMIDETYKGFTENLLHGGNVTEGTGVTFKCNAIDHKREANLVYHGNNNASYDFEDVYIFDNEGRDKNITKDHYTAPIIDFMSRLNQTTIPGSNVTITDLVDSAENTMIHIALSFLTGSWDGFWYQASNFYLNQNWQTTKWYLITYDFDETFGNGLEVPELMTTPYQNYSRPGSQRPLVDAFIKSPYYEPKFRDILKTIVQTFFNPRVIKPRLEAWMEMLKEDMEWDSSLPYRSPGQKSHFNVNNMLTTSHGTIGVLEWISNRTNALSHQLNFTYTANN
ncbi:coth protein-domain-containing protein [Cokeromyces recurvatus]|uniref:coth protein-domain-containing protein n=1 Tax=Cokeromyces recurvatus TaxID=90255 RepID=UPI00221F3132|nr:coth protein-domain-containing protein [Cokeromyces recurvatus]KAI7902000.1 coth protein-domain-containing protein [Cokeromyces recurvatus]